jgi:hypothetical protein
MPTANKTVVGDVPTMTITPTAELAKRRFVGLAGTGYCAADAKALGVTPENDSIPANTPGTVTMRGIVWVEASAEIAAGDPVGSTSTGKAVTIGAVTATPPSGATPVTSTGAQAAMTIAGGKLPKQINGWALDAASADGDFIRVKLV